jgi:hypothetical protein
MSVFSLPLKVNNAGFFELDKYQQDFLTDRLRIFLFSGDQKCLNLPSPGIYTFWQQINVLGPTSKFCDKDVFPNKDKELVEIKIRNEFNTWIDDEVIKSVRIIGDVNTKNGIIFRTNNTEYAFFFEFALIGRGLTSFSLGNFNIKEVVNVIY